MNAENLFHYYRAPAYVTPDNIIISPKCISSLYEVKNRTQEFVYITKIALSTFYFMCKQPILWLFNNPNGTILLLSAIIVFMSMLNYRNYRFQQERDKQYKEEIKTLKSQMAHMIPIEKILVRKNGDIAYYN